VAYSAHVDASPDNTGAARPSPGAAFLARYEPFREFDDAERERIAAAMTTRRVPKGEAVLVEGGEVGKELYVISRGAFDLDHQGVTIGVLRRGKVFGHPTLITGEPPEFTTRAREDSAVYCIPPELGLEVLVRPEGVRFVARGLRARLIDAARTMRALPDVRTRTLASLVRRAPVFCAPEASIRQAAALMAAEDVSALLVRMQDGLGIVTDVDLRDKVVAAGASPEGPVGAIVSSPVHTVSAETLAPEASIAMIEAGVNHLPVVDAQGEVIGVLSASSLMRLDSLSPFALRRSILAARSVDELAHVSAEVPSLIVDLLDANVDAPTLMRILTLLNDAQTVRLLQLFVAEEGPAPVPFAWLAFGSAARQELTLSSDQDNGLAYADDADPAAQDYFRRMALSVNGGLERCGFPADPHGVVASRDEWRLSYSQWREVFADCLRGIGLDRLVVAAITFDVRQVTGDLLTVPALQSIVRQAPRFDRFVNGLSNMATDIRMPLGFRHRVAGEVDLKHKALLPIQNLARYYALNSGFTAVTTLERLRAVEEAGVHGSESAQSLRDAFISLSELRLAQHAAAVREGRRPDDIVDTTRLKPLIRASLQEALREVQAAQRRPPATPDIDTIPRV
jgi:CBS domain-containing protein